MVFIMAHTIYPYLRRSFYKFSIKIIHYSYGNQFKYCQDHHVQDLSICHIITSSFFLNCNYVYQDDSWVGGSEEHLPFGHILKTILAEGQW
jgi:hypothetical protein